MLKIHAMKSQTFKTASGDEAAAGRLRKAQNEEMKMAKRFKDDEREESWTPAAA